MVFSKVGVIFGGQFHVRLFTLVGDGYCVVTSKLNIYKRAVIKIKFLFLILYLVILNWLQWLILTKQPMNVSEKVWKLNMKKISTLR